jgi:glutamyl-tRNA reductase
MTRPAESIVALLTHARDVPADARERFAEWARADVASHGLVLETCHRVELYLQLAAARDEQALRAALPGGGSLLSGDAAIRHAIAVAAGRDSVVVGEDQILHQLRAAMDRARARRSISPLLERLFSVALHAGRRARSWRHAPPPSLADAAVGAIEARAGPIAGRAFLVVGTGRMGRLAAGAATRAGASVSIANRSPDVAEDLAKAVGADVTAFDPGDGVRRFDAVIVAIGGPWRLGPTSSRALAQGTATVVDLSMPPAIPARVAANLGPRLVTVDDLAGRDGPEASPPDRTVARLDALIDRTTREFLAWLEGSERRAAADVLVQQAEREREAELAELWRRLPDLDPDARAKVEGMSRHLAERLLRGPLERLGQDVDGRHERAVRELWAL